ncbi:MAG: hypothetical protein M3Z26_08530 [Bacteroidota bacterium]|nr:hypothetical protein [Bacteroidota bacterium]
MKKIIFFLSILFFISIFIAGCGPSQIIVSQRPAIPAYVRPAPPSPFYVWVGGDWVWNGRGYVYRNGYWAPPRPGHGHYVPGHWRQKRQGWVWTRGHW